MSFNQKRRQVFLGEAYYKETEPVVKRGIEYFNHHPVGYGNSKEANDMYARASSAFDRVRLLLLHYTAGNDIELLRDELEDIVSAYERYGKKSGPIIKTATSPFSILSSWMTISPSYS